MRGQGYVVFSNNNANGFLLPSDRMIVFSEYQEALSYLNDETLNKDLNDG